MALRTADRFKFDLLGQLEMERARAKDDLEDAGKEVQRSAGLDFDIRRPEQFERCSEAAIRQREHRATVVALEQVIEIVQGVKLTE